MLAYKATHRESGMVYIGITCRTLNTRMREHLSRSQTAKTPFHVAIRTFGVDALEWAVLEECSTREELLLLEKKYVSEFAANDPMYGFNCTRGGSGIAGFVMSQESRAKLSSAGMGRPKSAKEREKLSAAHRGRAPSDACREAWRKSPLVKEWLVEFGRARKGTTFKHSPEAIEKIRTSRRKAIEEGRGCKIQPCHIEEILRLRGEGKSYRTIGEIFGVHGATIHLFVKRMMP
ncbi:GIY-YIG nuclease family protein [Burkholderia multivorans]|uniref:GIY-YIG nuclease family protein n=1 Tax=Burkholderia multivorans TaxID=87883 RepID=UPI000CFFFADB|nr:GIY-YIG nuclease family protein [Burkholderia multivorans]PRH31904.1 hypothetical protein C6T53_04945 [Burkholderia multivorans]